MSFPGFNEKLKVSSRAVYLVSRPLRRAALPPGGPSATLSPRKPAPQASEEAKRVGNHGLSRQPGSSASHHELPISSIAGKDVNRTKETVSANRIRQPSKLGISFRDSRGNHENERPRSNENKSSTLFIQPGPVRHQARILRPTEVGCKLPAVGNAELSRMNRALTRQRPRAPSEAHGTGAIPLCGSRPPSTSVGIHEERRELKCESTVVFRFGSSFKPPRGATRKKRCSKDRLFPRERPIERTMKRKMERLPREKLAPPKRNKPIRGRRSLRQPSPAPLQPRREGTDPWMEPHAPSSGLAASTRRLLFDWWKAAGPVCRSRSFNEPGLLQTAGNRICVS